jgi:malate dehydrogenase (oxaloacetate-decarboxylating)(NADP+)
MPDTKPKRHATDDHATRRRCYFHASTARPGKIEIAPTKPMATQRDLSLAYSPGVAVPVQGHRGGSRARPTTTRPRATSWP